MDKPRILVINDDTCLRDFFRFNLSARGFEVDFTCADSETMAYVGQEKPDVVILDLMVRGRDGFDLCREICDSEISPVVVMNMRSRDGDLRRCFEMGVAEYLGKPFGVDELMARIKGVLRHRRWTKVPAGSPS